VFVFSFFIVLRSILLCSRSSSCFVCVVRFQCSPPKHTLITSPPQARVNFFVFWRGFGPPACTVLELRIPSFFWCLVGCSGTPFSPWAGRPRGCSGGLWSRFLSFLCCCLVLLSGHVRTFPTLTPAEQVSSPPKLYYWSVLGPEYSPACGVCGLVCPPPTPFVFRTLFVYAVSFFFFFAGR